MVSEEDAELGKRSRASAMATSSLLRWSIRRGCPTSAGPAGSSARSAGGSVTGDPGARIRCRHDRRNRRHRPYRRGNRCGFIPMGGSRSWWRSATSRLRSGLRAEQAAGRRLRAAPFFIAEIVSGASAAAITAHSASVRQIAAGLDLFSPNGRRAGFPPVASATTGIIATPGLLRYWASRRESNRRSWASSNCKSVSTVNGKP